MTVSGVGHCRQVGCPESGVDAAIAELVRRGHKVGRSRADGNRRRSQGADGEQNGGDTPELLEVTSPATPWTATARAEGASRAFDPRTSWRSPPRRSPSEEDGDAKASATVGFAFLEAAAGTLRVGSFADERALRLVRAQSPPRCRAPHADLPSGGARAPRRWRPNGGAREGGARQRRPERRAARHERRERRRRGRTAEGYFFPARARARGRGARALLSARTRKTTRRVPRKIRKATKATKAGTKAFSRLSRRSPRRRGARWPRSRRT